MVSELLLHELVMRREQRRNQNKYNIPHADMSARHAVCGTLRRKHRPLQSMGNSGLTYILPLREPEGRVTLRQLVMKGMESRYECGNDVFTVGKGNGNNRGNFFPYAVVFPSGRTGIVIWKNVKEGMAAGNQ